jgi:predicted amidohydrolase
MQMRANETRTKKILNQVSSPGGGKFREFMEELKRLLEVETSSVDQNEIRGKLVQRQADQMDQVDFDVNLMKIGEKLKVTVSTHGEKLIVGTLSVESLDRRLKLDETVIELQEGDALTSAIRSRNFYLPCRLASGVPPDFIEFKIGLEIAGQKPIEKRATLTLGNDIEIEGKHVVIDPITLPREFLIYEDEIEIALVQLEIDLVHDGRGYRIGGNLEAYRKKIQDVFSKLPEGVGMVIFPELSIPFEFLSELQHISERRKLLIVAGSHYVRSTDGYLELNFVRPVHEKDIWKSISPLITPSKRIYHSEKIFPAPKTEQDMTKGDYLNIYRFHNYNYKFTVLICADFECSIPEALVKKYGIELINVISVNSGKSARERYYNKFSSLARSRGSIAFTYTNVSGFSLDGISKSTDDEPVECGHSNIFSEYYREEKEHGHHEKEWCKHFTENLEGDLIRIVELNLKGGTRASTPIDYVPIFKEIDLIRLD